MSTRKILKFIGETGIFYVFQKNTTYYTLLETLTALCFKNNLSANLKSMTFYKNKKEMRKDCLNLDIPKQFKFGIGVFCPQQ